MTALLIRERRFVISLQVHPCSPSDAWYAHNSSHDSPRYHDQHRYCSCNAIGLATLRRWNCVGQPLPFHPAATHSSSCGNTPDSDHVTAADLQLVASCSSPWRDRAILNAGCGRWAERTPIGCHHSACPPSRRTAAARDRFGLCFYCYLQSCDRIRRHQVGGCLTRRLDDGDFRTSPYISEADIGSAQLTR